MNRPAPPSLDGRASALAVGLLAGAVYLNSLGNGFAYDDVHIIELNSGIQAWQTLPEALLRPYWPGPFGKELGLWRPVTSGMFGVAHIVGSGSPFVFHAMNVLAHVANSLLVLGLLRLLLSASAALSGALLFAVHPVHTEAVANVVGFSELASTAFVLVALIVHIRGGAVSSWSTALTIGVLYALGFGAKESAVTLPGLIFLVDAARVRLSLSEIPRYIRDRWRVYLILLTLTIALLLARLQILGSVASPIAPLGAGLLDEIPRIWTLGEVWMHYVRLWVFPIDLSADYSPGVIPISVGWGVENTLGVGLILLLLSAALLSWRKPDLMRGHDSGKSAAFGAVWFLITISPISNTVFLSGVLLAERTLYLPSVGLAAASGWLVLRLARDRRRVAWIGFSLALVTGSVRTWVRNPSWHDSVSVFNTMIADYPQSGRSQWILGDELMGRGRVSEALRSYRAAILLLGRDYQPLVAISRKLMAEEHYRAAELLLKFAIEDSPQYPVAFGLLASIRAEYGDADETEAYARAALELESFDPIRQHLLAWALIRQGLVEEATAARARGIEQGEVVFWQQDMFEAYGRMAQADSMGAYAWVDSAWSRVVTDVGRATLDSLRVADFGLAPLREERNGPPDRYQ